MAEPRTRESKDTNEQQVVTTGDLPGWQWPNAASERHPQPPLPNRRLDAALEQVSRGCACALLNTAALLKTSDSRIPDLTEQVAQATGLVLPASTTK